MECLDATQIPHYRLYRCIVSLSALPPLNTNVMRYSQPGNQIYLMVCTALKISLCCVCIYIYIYMYIYIYTHIYIYIYMYSQTSKLTDHGTNFKWFIQRESQIKDLEYLYVRSSGIVIQRSIGEWSIRAVLLYIHINKRYVAVYTYWFVYMYHSFPDGKHI